MDRVDDAIWALLDDDNPDNDATAYGYQETLENLGFGIFYWSTNEHAWYQ